MDRLSRRSMVVPNGTDEDQARRYVRIFNVLQEERGSPPRTAASWVRAWIEPSLQMLFLKTPVILAEREKRHTANKFVGQTLPIERPLPVTPGIYTWQSGIANVSGLLS